MDCTFTCTPTYSCVDQFWGSLLQTRAFLLWKPFQDNNSWKQKRKNYCSKISNSCGRRNWRIERKLKKPSPYLLKGTGINELTGPISEVFIDPRPALKFCALKSGLKILCLSAVEIFGPWIPEKTNELWTVSQRCSWFYHRCETASKWRKVGDIPNR